MLGSPNKDYGEYPLVEGDVVKSRGNFQELQKNVLLPSSG